jgi:hypothetical protein
MPAESSNAAGTTAHWGELLAPQSPQDVLAAMRALSKAGKLAGFTESASNSHETFRVAAFAMPFDRELIAHVTPTASGSALRFTPKLLLKMPIIFAVISILSIWPGVWLTDSMIRTYVSSYDFNTNLWYIPLTVISLVWYLWGSWKRSTREARESAHEAMMKMHQALQGSELTSFVGTAASTSPSPVPSA